MISMNLSQLSGNVPQKSDISSFLMISVRQISSKTRVNEYQDTTTYYQYSISPRCPESMSKKAYLDMKKAFWKSWKCPFVKRKFVLQINVNNDSEVISYIVCKPTWMKSCMLYLSYYLSLGTWITLLIQITADICL